MTQEHHDSLDGIRGLAVLSVMLFHAWLFPTELKISGTALPWALDVLVKHGGLGVDLFFVLSGFLITQILRRTRTRPRYFKNFYARRALRIFPLYYMALLILVIVYQLWPEPRLTIGTARFWPWVLTFTTNILIAREGAFGALPKSLHHFWTLAIEEQFYLLWPATVFYLPKRLLAAGCVVLIFLSPILRFIWSGDAWIQGYVSTFARFDGLAMGALLAIYFERVSPKWATRLLAFGAGALGVVWFESSALGWFENSAMNCVAAGLIGAGLRTKSIGRLLSLNWLTYLGRRSYGLYVIHQPLTVAVMLLPSMAGLPALAYLAIPFLSLPLAELSWRFLERPCLKLKDRFSF